MMTIYPDPHTIYPLKNYNRLCFLKNIVNNPNIIVGDFTYYDDIENTQNFHKNVLYHFDFIGDKLIIVKFCAIASNVKFIMNGGTGQLKKSLKILPSYVAMM
jgi:virginiamycin A acetyltransferase